MTLRPAVSAALGVNPLASLVESLAKSERAPSTHVVGNQNRLLAALIKHHASNTPQFKERLRKLNLDETKLSPSEIFQNLVPLKRRDIQSAGKSFSASQIPPSHLPLGSIKTSGSTGEPVSMEKSAINRLFWSAFTVRDHVWNKRSFANRMSSIRANISKYTLVPNWGAPVSLLFQTGPAQGIPITTPIEKQIELISEFKPEILLVYPNNLNALLNVWNTSGCQPNSLKHLKTIGETVSADLRVRAKAVCRLAIEDNYSSQEAGPIAIQCDQGLYHTMDEALIVEVLNERDEPCREGETGRVIITDLFNYAAPLIRYDIGDFAERGGMCGCGRTLATLKKILGRERNLIKKPNGDRHWPLVGFHEFDQVTPVRQYQFVQHTLTEIEFKLVTDEPLTDVQMRGLLEICRHALGTEFNFRISQFRTRIEPGANGKFEEFVCKVQ